MVHNITYTTLPTHCCCLFILKPLFSSIILILKQNIMRATNISIDCMAHLLPGQLIRRLREGENGLIISTRVINCFVIAANCTSTYSVLVTTDEKFADLQFTPSEVLEIRNAVSKFVMPKHQPLTGITQRVSKDSFTKGNSNRYGVHSNWKMETYYNWLHGDRQNPWQRDIDCWDN